MTTFAHGDLVKVIKQSELEEEHHYFAIGSIVRVLGPAPHKVTEDGVAYLVQGTLAQSELGMRGHPRASDTELEQTIRENCLEIVSHAYSFP